MEINYLAVVVCGILSMIVGAMWFGPLFGKQWMKIIGASAQDEVARKAMQKSVGKLYAIQFLLTLFQVWVLAFYITGWEEASGVTNALWIWAAFIIPTVAGSAMWNMNSTKVKWAQFLIQGGYQLVMFVIFGVILGMWK